MPSDHPDDVRVRQILLNEGSMATPLFLICYNKWGEEFMEWESETLDLEIEDAFQVLIPPDNLDKIHALVSALISDSFYRDWSAFTVICQTLAGGSDVMNLSDPMIVEEVAIGLMEVMLNDSTPGTFSDEVKRYVGLILHEQGFVKPPKILEWAHMPSVYRGSDSKADLHQEIDTDTAHRAVVEQVMEETSLLLFKQISLLPFVTPDHLREMVGQLSS